MTGRRRPGEAAGEGRTTGWEAMVAAHELGRAMALTLRGPRHHGHAGHGGEHLGS
ncbi:hypothetical protein [Actinomadura sp. SCN-SB]|uniref:hypothetical protein n=1 Tax=Actinomadura sp. SCN-SB TaxID=3373092 RepID=UPI0037530072